MNDEEVSRVGVDHVLSQSAYILLYEKQDANMMRLNSVATKPPLVALLPKKEVDLFKDVPLNSTCVWTVGKASQTIETSTPLLNATVTFQVSKMPTLQTTSSRSESGGSVTAVNDSSASIIVTAASESIAVKQQNVDNHVKLLKEFRPFESASPPNQYENSNKQVRNVNGGVVNGRNNQSFLEELQNQAPIVSAWNHVATSDAAFERRLYLDDIQREKKLKRKRASKEDMEYDQPKRKGFKKRNQQQGGFIH